MGVALQQPVALGPGQATVYRYVSGKPDLLNGVHGLILEQVERPPATGAWQDRLRNLAWAMRVVLARHPRALTLFANRPAVSPGSLRRVEDCLAIFAEAGFDPAERLPAFHTVANFVVGLSTSSSASTSPPTKTSRSTPTRSRS